MDQNAFEAYLDRQVMSDDSAPVGRFCKTVFGTQERVVLPQTYWLYADWVADDQGEDLEAWIIRCDEHRGDKTLSENLMEWLYWDMCDRIAQGHPFPEFLQKPALPDS